MALSNDLVHEFVKVTNDGTEIKQESTVYGRIVKLNNATYVRIDGSDLLTPIISTVAVSDGDRVTVMIKNHTATVTGNTSSPAAKDSDLSDLSNVVADKVSTEELEAEKARISDLEADNLTVKDKLTANEAYISDLQADNVEIKNKLTAAEGSITKLETEKLDANAADIKFATIENLEVTNETVRNIQGDFATFENATIEKLNAHDADIDDLYANKLSAESADIRYANIDFSNIGQAAMEHFYAQSGLIKNVVVGDQTITGELVGVTIRGDLIEANTVVADKLVIKGDDGLYYKLNTDGVTTESEQTDYNSLNGQIIRAKSVTAEKIAVDDLVAFNATIGGFNITSDAIYSGVKETVNNTTRGIYMDNTGQIAFGDAHNYLKFFKASDGSWKLIMSASTMIMSSGKTVDAAIDEVEQKIEFVVGSGSTASSVTITEAAIQAITRQFTIKDYSGGTTVISGGKLVTSDLRALGATIAGWEIGDGYIRHKDANNRYVGLGRDGVTYAFFAGGTDANGANANFRVDHGGGLIANNATITGNITATTLIVQQSIYSETTTIINTTGTINYKNILSTNAEGGYNSYLGIYAESDQYGGSGAVDRAKITFALNDIRAYNGAREADINLYASGYIRISADEQVYINDCTFNGSVTFANGTWNLVGDDVYIGDHNVGGALCIKSATVNYPTGIVFYAPDESSTGHLYYAAPNNTFQTNCGLNLPSFDAGQVCQLRLSWAGTSVIFRYDGSDFYIMPSDGDTGTSKWSCIPFAIGRTGVVSIIGTSIYHRTMTLLNSSGFNCRGINGVDYGMFGCTSSGNFHFGYGGYDASYSSTYYSGNTVYLRARTHLYRNLSWEQGSDARLKHGVSDMPAEFLTAYMDIKPVQFFWNDKPQLGKQCGVIAQQVLEAFDKNGISIYDANIVSISEDTEMYGFNAYTVNYDFLNVLTMAVAQNHEKRIKELEKELALLKDANGLKEE